MTRTKHSLFTLLFSLSALAIALGGARAEDDGKLPVAAAKAVHDAFPQGAVRGFEEVVDQAPLYAVEVLQGEKTLVVHVTEAGLVVSIHEPKPQAPEAVTKAFAGLSPQEPAQDLTRIEERAELKYAPLAAPRVFYGAIVIQEETPYYVTVDASGTVLKKEEAEYEEEEGEEH